MVGWSRQLTYVHAKGIVQYRIHIRCDLSFRMGVFHATLLRASMIGRKTVEETGARATPASWSAEHVRDWTQTRQSNPPFPDRAESRPSATVWDTQPESHTSPTSRFPIDLVLAPIPNVCAGPVGVVEAPRCPIVPVPPSPPILVFELGRSAPRVHRQSTHRDSRRFLLSDLWPLSCRGEEIGSGWLLLRSFAARSKLRLIGSTPGITLVQ